MIRSRSNCPFCRHASTHRTPFAGVLFAYRRHNFASKSWKQNTEVFVRRALRVQELVAEASCHIVTLCHRNKLSHCDDSVIKTAVTESIVTLWSGLSSRKILFRIKIYNLWPWAFQLSLWLIKFFQLTNSWSLRIITYKVFTSNQIRAYITLKFPTINAKS